jgi:hypothetical protein
MSKDSLPVTTAQLAKRIPRSLFEEIPRQVRKKTISQDLKSHCLNIFNAANGIAMHYHTDSAKALQIFRWCLEPTTNMEMDEDVKDAYRFIRSYMEGKAAHVQNPTEAFPKLQAFIRSLLKTMTEGIEQHRDWILGIKDSEGNLLDDKRAMGPPATSEPNAAAGASSHAQKVEIDKKNKRRLTVTLVAYSSYSFTMANSYQASSGFET